jgi:benzodiazapine receptor
MPRRIPRDWPALIGWIVLSQAAGLIGSIANRRSAEFYATLEQPGWAPPSWVFAPVWTMVYVLMGIAAWLVWRERPASPQANRTRRAAIIAFLVQLALNALWTWIFFAWRQGALAFAEILVLWACIMLTIMLFGRVQRAAAWLLAPYLAWVSFAAVLTWTIWQLNAGVL